MERKHRALLLALPTVLTLLFFFVAPMVYILVHTLHENGFSDFVDFFGDPFYRNILWVTLRVSLVSTAISLVLGYPTAFYMARTKSRMKQVMMIVILFPFLVSAVVRSYGWMVILGTNGLLNQLLQSLGLISAPLKILNTETAVIIGMIHLLVPYMVLSLVGVLQSIDPNVEYAAYSLGASPLQTFSKVVFPLSLPGIISGCLLVFIQSLEDFSNPATIGGDYTTLSIEVYNIITGSYDMRKGSVLALLLLLPAVIAYLLNKYWVNKKSFVTVTGKPTQARKLIEEPHIKWPLFAFCLIVSAIIILFYGTVIFASFVRTWGVDFSLTLDQYRKALQYGWDSLKNSMTLGLISAVIGGLLGMVIAYITAKRNYYGKRFIEVASVLMFAVPGTVLGISYILGFNSKPLALTGTGLILVIVFTFRNMPVAIESGTTTLLQIDNSIEEASTILGADTGYSFRRITLPMLKNAFFSGIVYSFTKAITAVSAVIFLVSPRWKLVTSNIYSLFDMAKYGQAAAFVTMMVGILLVFIGLFNTVINFLLAPRSKVPQAKTKTEESK